MKTYIGIGKSKMTQFGFEGLYWAVSSVSVDVHGRTFSGVLRLYKDLAQCEADRNSFLESAVITSDRDYIDEATGEFIINKDLFTQYYGSNIVRGGVNNALLQMAVEQDERFEGGLLLEDPTAPPPQEEEPLTPEQYINNFREDIQTIKQSGLPLAGAQTIVNEEYKK